jgi:protein-S-isoprenylcysteine O-methyltransferase Ste14
MNSLLVFAVVTAFFVYVSRHMLMRPQVHGFYRFFAWECILVLVLLNAPHWTTDPLALHQIISWLFLVISIFLVIHGVRLLKALGKPDPNRPEADLLAFEKTTQLVTTGAYQYIRHPLYASLLFLAWGVFFKHPSLPGVLLAAAASLFLIITAKKDEAECLQHFGAAYRAYMQRTRMFIPFVY